MELKLPTQTQLSLVYNRDLRSSFPPSEMKTLAFIRKTWERNSYRPYCLFDGEEIVGEAFLWLGRPGWALLDYLCVAASRRSSGLGGLLQRALVEAEPPGTVIFGEVEVPAYAPDPEMAERRLEFYRRGGWRDAGYDSEIYSAHYRGIYLADREIPTEELVDQHRYVYQSVMTPKQCRRFIRIPWDPNYHTPPR